LVKQNGFSTRSLNAPENQRYVRKALFSTVQNIYNCPFKFFGLGQIFNTFVFTINYSTNFKTCYKLGITAKNSYSVGDGCGVEKCEKSYAACIGCMNSSGFIKLKDFDDVSSYTETEYAKGYLNGVIYGSVMA